MHSRPLFSMQAFQTLGNPRPYTSPSVENKTLTILIYGQVAGVSLQNLRGKKKVAFQCLNSSRDWKAGEGMKKV